MNSRSNTHTEGDREYLREREKESKKRVATENECFSKFNSQMINKATLPVGIKFLENWIGSELSVREHRVSI